MHLWLHLCSVHESDSCITSCQQSWWYNLRLHCVMIWCHTMSYHVIPDSSMCHSTTQQLSHSTHFCISFAACFCPRTIQGHPRQWMKTMAQSCAIWLFWLNFINFDVLWCSVSTPATATCDATGLCFCLRESMILSQETQNAKVNSKQQNLAVDMCGSSNGTPMDPHGSTWSVFSMLQHQPLSKLSPLTDWWGSTSQR